MGERKHDAHRPLRRKMQGEGDSQLIECWKYIASVSFASELASTVVTWSLARILPLALDHTEDSRVFHGFRQRNRSQRWDLTKLRAVGSRSAESGFRFVPVCTASCPRRCPIETPGLALPRGHSLPASERGAWAPIRRRSSDANTLQSAENTGSSTERGRIARRLRRQRQTGPSGCGCWELEPRGRFWDPGWGSCQSRKLSSEQ